MVVVTFVHSYLCLPQSCVFWGRGIHAASPWPHPSACLPSHQPRPAHHTSPEYIHAYNKLFWQWNNTIHLCCGYTAALLVVRPVTWFLLASVVSSAGTDPTLLLWIEQDNVREMQCFLSSFVEFCITRFLFLPCIVEFDFTVSTPLFHS